VFETFDQAVASNPDAMGEASALFGCLKRLPATQYSCWKKKIFLLFHCLLDGEQLRNRLLRKGRFNL
jgi:hypothetical protein